MNRHAPPPPRPAPALPERESDPAVAPPLPQGGGGSGWGWEAGPIDRAAILTLIPHQGASCLLDRVLSRCADDIVCETTSHLDPANPLRRAGMLGALTGAEYGMQAAALHGALTQGATQPPGFAAALRNLVLAVERLDDPAFGPLRVEAARELSGPAGTVYRFRLTAADGTDLVSGQATIAFPALSCLATTR